jgi:hypothetical protein
VNENRDKDSNFERKLLDELKTVVARQGAEQEASIESAAHAPAWRRRAPRLAVGATAAFTAAAAVLVFNSGGGNTPQAFAVEPQDGGGVTIKVNSPENSRGLEAALAEAGVRSQVTWLPAGMACREPHFTPSSVKTALGGTIVGLTMGGPAPAMTIGVMDGERLREQWRAYRQGEISEDDFHNSTGNITLDPAEFSPDQTVVISGSPGPYDGNPEGGYEARFAIAEGPVEPCDPVKIPDGGTLGAMNAMLESERASGESEETPSPKAASPEAE